MLWLYDKILYQPLYNILIGLYNIIPGHDIGIAIILLTIIIKVVLYPLSAKSIKSQQALSALQPKMDALKKQYADNKELLAQETMKLYRENKVNPLSSCLPLLLQIPFMIAVYQVFRDGLHNGGLDMLYPFISNPGTVSPWSLGLIDLSVRSIPLAVMAGAAQFLQTKMLMHQQAPKVVKDGAKDENMMAEMNKSMMYMMPIMTVVFGASLPAGLTLYWFVTTVLTIVQQKFVLKPKAGDPTVTPPSDAKPVQAEVK